MTREEHDEVYMAGFREAVRRCSEVVKQTGAHLRAALDAMTKLEPMKPREPVAWVSGDLDVPTCSECGSIRCRPLPGYVAPPSSPDGLFCPNCGERAERAKDTPG